MWAFTTCRPDPHLHSFDAATGKEVWTLELPAAAQSTPMTYEWEGKQYKSKMGDAVVAFRLDEQNMGCALSP